MMAINAHSLKTKPSDQSILSKLETSYDENRNQGRSGGFMDELLNKKLWEASRDPKLDEIKFSKMELLRMLSSYEGELQARDEVIAILRNDYAQNLNEMYNLEGSGAVRALARDTDNLNAEMMSHVHRKNINEGQAVIQHYKKSYEKLKKLHFALEKKYGKLLEDVGVERKINEEFRKKLNKFVKALERDREDLQKLLRDKAIMYTSEEEWPDQTRITKAKIYRKRIRRTNPSEKIKSALKSREEGTQTQEKEDSEVETLKKTVSEMRSAEKKHKQIEKECDELRIALEEEVKRTKDLRKEFQRFQENTSYKVEVENAVAEAFARFDNVQQGFEEECKKQHKMELQVENFKQLFDEVSELELLSKSSEHQVMQMQATLRESKSEKYRLMTKLEEAERKLAEYEERLEQQGKSKSSSPQDSNVSTLSKTLQTYEENCAEDMKHLHLKLSAAEKAIQIMTGKENSSGMKFQVTDFRSQISNQQKKVGKSSKENDSQIRTTYTNLFISSLELRKLLSIESDDVIAVTRSSDNKNNLRYLTLEFKNDKILEEINKLEASQAQVKANNLRKVNHEETTKKISSEPTSPTGSTTPALKSKVTPLSNLQTSTRRFGLKKSGSGSDIYRSQSKSEANRISTRPVSLCAKKIPQAGSLRRLNERSNKSTSSTLTKQSPATSILMKQPSTSPTLTKQSSTSSTLMKQPSTSPTLAKSSSTSPTLTKQPLTSNDSRNLKTPLRYNQFPSSSINKTHPSNLNQQNKSNRNIRVSPTSTTERISFSQNKTLETSRRRYSGSFSSDNKTPSTLPRQLVSKLAATKLAATSSAISRSNSVGARNKPTSTLSKIRTSSVSTSSTTRLLKSKTSPTLMNKPKYSRSSGQTR